MKLLPSKKHQIAQLVFLLSGFAIWYLSFIVSAYTLAVLLWAYTSGGAVIHPVIVGIAVVVELYLGIAFARVILRVWPRSLDGTSHRKEVMLILVLLAVYCATLATGWSYLAADAAPRYAQSLQDNPIILLSIVLLFVVWMGTVATILVSRRLDPATVLDSPFTLFLRCFSTISDRSVAHAVMSSNSAVRPTALLVPRLTEPEDWNPVTVFMAGVRPWAPLRSSPVFLRSDDDNWVDAVRRLIDRAEVVVIDGSEISDAVSIELNLIHDLQAWSKTILLLDSRKEESHSGLPAHTPLSVIAYRLSWKGALPRLLLGVLLVIPVTLPITGPIVLFMQWLDTKLFPETLVFEVLALLLAFLTLGWIYKLLFVRPEMDRDSKRRLGAVLKGSGRAGRRM